MIERILPGIAAAETFETVLDEPLYPQEEAAIAKAVAKRRNEFRTVRACARLALRELGIDRPALVPGTAGAPSWPEGIVGSMTHCDGYRAAAVATTIQATSIGIDAEPNLPLPEGVLGSIAAANDLDQLDRLAHTTPAIAWDRLLFCAKESVYKAWYPLMSQWLGFEQARVELAPDGTFIATLLVPGPVVDGRPLEQLPGRWVADHGLLLTAVVISAASAVSTESAGSVGRAVDSGR